MAHCLVMPLKGCHLSYVFWSFDCKLSEGGSTWLHIHAQMHVCVCVHLCPSMCAFLYLHTCMGLYVSRCMCIHVCESTHVCIHKLMSVCVHLCMCIFMQVCVYLHKCMCVLMCGIACAHIRAYQMLHVHAGEQMCLCVCICCFICFCVCLCMCSSVCAHTHICGKLLRTCTATYIYTNIYQRTKFSVMWLILGWPYAVDGALKLKKKMEGWVVYEQGADPQHLEIIRCNPDNEGASSNNNRAVKC